MTDNAARSGGRDSDIEALREDLDAAREERDQLWEQREDARAMLREFLGLAPPIEDWRHTEAMAQAVSMDFSPRQIDRVREIMRQPLPHPLDASVEKP